MIRTIALVAALCLAPASLAACSSGGGLPTCQGGEENSTCDSCKTSKCSANVSSYLSDCPAYDSCIEGCQCSDLSCVNACSGGLTGKCNAAVLSFQDCEVSRCSSECGPFK